jgi:hypothetical protein
MVINQTSYEDFSLSGGGPFHNALVRLNLHNHHIKPVLVAWCITWLPLAILAAFQGTLYAGSDLPFLRDAAMQTRLLIALPMLFLISKPIDLKVRAVGKYLSEVMVTPEERVRVLAPAFQRAIKWTHSWTTELILLLVVVITTFTLVRGDVLSELQGSANSWMANSGSGVQVLSLAGKWALFISLPVFQFLLLRWLWRYLIWVLLLSRLSKSRLNLLPTHADQSGGLGVLMLAQKSFNLLFVTCSVVIAGQLLAQLIRFPDTFVSLRNVGIAFMVLSILLLLFPMLFFLAKLARTKQKGLLELGQLGASLSRQFEKEWLSNLPIEQRIAESQSDPSMLCDFAAMHDSLQNMRILPVTVKEIAGMVVIQVLPFIPMLFVHYSVLELLHKIAGLLV